MKRYRIILERVQMKKILIPTLCALLLILSLAACGGQKIDEDAAAAAASPLPTPTAGTQITTFMCKVTSIKNTDLKITMYNVTLKTTTYEAPSEVVPDADEPVSASPSADAALTTKPPSSSGESKNITVVVPPNVVVTLMDGTTGKLSDIKNGNVVNMTMIGTSITEISLVSLE